MTDFRKMLDIIENGGEDGVILQTIWQKSKPIYGWSTKRIMNQQLHKWTIDGTVIRKLHDNYPSYYSSNNNIHTLSRMSITIPETINIDSSSDYCSSNINPAFHVGAEYPNVNRESATIEFKGRSNDTKSDEWSFENARKALRNNVRYFAWAINTQLLKRGRLSDITLVLGVHDSTMTMHGIRCGYLVNTPQNKLRFIQDVKVMEQTLRDTFIQSIVVVRPRNEKSPILLWSEALTVETIRLHSNNNATFLLFIIKISPSLLCHKFANYPCLLMTRYKHRDICNYRDGEHTKCVPLH